MSAPRFAHAVALVLLLAIASTVVRADTITELGFWESGGCDGVDVH